MFPDLSTVSTIAFDTETSGLDPHDDRPVGYVVTWGFRPEESVYLPIRHEGGGNLEPGPVIEFVRKNLSRTDLRVVMHNAAFDLWMAGKDGIEINGPIEDTGLNDPLINENLSSKDGLRSAGYNGPGYMTGYSLAACCSRARVQAKLAQPMYEYLAKRFGGKPTRDQMSNFWKLPGDDEMAVDYAAGDGTSTLQLWAHQQGQLDSQDLRRVWKVECDLIPVLHRARVRGVPIDENELARVNEQITKESEEALEELGGLNPRAPSEIKKYLNDKATNYGEHEWDEKIVPRPGMTSPSKRFPQGQESYNKDYLNKFEIGQNIMWPRKLIHLKSSFISPLIERHLHNGMVYPNFWQLASDDYGTVTGRFSSSSPNLQQVPKRDKRLGRIFRRVFVPPEGMTLWEMDYSQCEYRLFAHFARSERLIRGYNEDDIDMHDMVAKLVSIGRDPAKTLNFAILYGAGAKRVAGQLGISVAEAKSLIAQYFQEIPEAKAFKDLASSRAM
ncbi:MAG: DNA polymerase, partial [Geminicoccaceae bacterium]